MLCSTPRGQSALGQAGLGSPSLSSFGRGSPIRAVTLSPMAAAKLSISGQPVLGFPPLAGRESPWLHKAGARGSSWAYLRRT